MIGSVSRAGQLWHPSQSSRHPRNKGGLHDDLRRAHTIVNRLRIMPGDSHRILVIGISRQRFILTSKRSVVNPHTPLTRRSFRAAAPMSATGTDRLCQANYFTSRMSAQFFNQNITDLFCGMSISIQRRLSSLWMPGVEHFKDRGLIHAY